MARIVEDLNVRLRVFCNNLLQPLLINLQGQVGQKLNVPSTSGILGSLQHEIALEFSQVKEKPDENMEKLRLWSLCSA
jgi:hypothetical protein